MCSDILSNFELYGVLEIIHSLMFIEENNELKSIARSLAELVEFDFIIFGLPNPAIAHPQIIVDLNINFPQDWLRFYRKNNYRLEPFILTTRQKCFPRYWADIYRRFFPDRKLDELSPDIGLQDGYLCALAGGRKTRKNHDKREEYILERLSPHFHMALSSLRAKGEAKRIQSLLTKREYEVLKWLSAGKTSWEIAIILKVAEATINYHVKNINAKLNTVSRRHAVAVVAHIGMDL